MIKKPARHLRKGQHEGLIDYTTFERIQERLNDKARAPARADIQEDFILRVLVACASCGHPLTASWSTSKTGKKHPYYECFKKGCSSRRKSIRRDVLEKDFEALVKALRPTEALFNVARAMFAKIWDYRIASAEAMARSVQSEAAKLEKQIGALVDRIVDATSDSVIKAYESRIRALEEKKASLLEQANFIRTPKKSFENAFRTPMAFLSNPWKLWDSGDLVQRRMLMKIAFSSHPRYCRENGFSNPDLSLPFKALMGSEMHKCEMAHPSGFEPETFAFGGQLLRLFIF
ncbi:recombinase zinc beta ribbon domain-containing protein [Woodsholea maritima]|uniref:recombinase zinc beta ribbon domain-containing protein n=1 Tax=Woodsholea maritima TaxID=240237 RepID=UPI000361C349|nr:recombinase zinc beta ribbon domain-containing protein [Woodsholea maritima]